MLPGIHPSIYPTKNPLNYQDLVLFSVLGHALLGCLLKHLFYFETKRRGSRLKAEHVRNVTKKIPKLLHSNIYKGLGSTRFYTLQKTERVLGMAEWLNANWEPLVSACCWRAYVISTWQLMEVWNRIISHSCPPFWNNENENNLFLSPPRNRKTWKGTRILKQKIPGEKSDFSIPKKSTSSNTSLASAFSV